MAALLVSVAVMGVLMSVAMPVWRQQAIREKEAELVFRGEQYARAIALYQKKYPGAFPPSIDILVEQRFLRKKYLDPMTEDGEFQLLYAAQIAGGAGPGRGTGSGAQGGRGSPPPTGRTGGPPTGSPRPGFTQSAPGGGALRGGIIGVASKSTEASVLIYNGQTHYNEWQFVFTPLAGQPGQPLGPPGLQPGGQPGMGPPGQRGRGGLRGPGGQRGPGAGPSRRGGRQGTIRPSGGAIRPPS